MGHWIGSVRRPAWCLALLAVVAATAGFAPAGAATSDFTHVASPNGHDLQSSLQDVSCVSTSSCIAVGSTEGGPSSPSATLVESWNGTSWSVVPSPNATPDDLLDAVSCATADSCMAIGSAGPSFNAMSEDPLAESWDGTTWSVVAVPEPPGTFSIGLDAVSCPAVDDCLAVGSATSDQFNYGHPEELVERWDGSSWRILPTALTPVNGTTSTFTSVSCASGRYCVAAGDTGTGNGAYPLVESWDGSAWTWQRTAPLPGQDEGAAVEGVTCVWKDACFLVGGMAYYAGYFFEHWNGTTWSLTDNSNVSGAVYPSSISCSTAGRCLAVAPVQSVLAHAVPLAFEYANGQWSTVRTAPVPSPAFDAELSAVSCVADGPCTAVGTDSVTEGRTLVETTPAA